MNITGDNINTVQNTDDCTVLIRDTESPTTKTKISFKSEIIKNTVFGWFTSRSA